MTGPQDGSSSLPATRVLVCFHAHPDDEVFTTGGVMRLAADAGHRVVLVTATDGALGEVPEEDAVKLPPNHYFWHQIVGLQAVTAEGAVLGKIDEILETGSNDVYVVHGPEGELLIPAIKQVVKAIDLNSGTMTVELMPELD